MDLASDRPRAARRNSSSFCLHGLGADGQDLIGIAPHWAQVLPNAAFVSPNAPFPCDMAPYGYQWFSVQDRSPEAMLSGVRMAASPLDDFIDRELERAGLDESKHRAGRLQPGHDDEPVTSGRGASGSSRVSSAFPDA